MLYFPPSHLEPLSCDVDKQFDIFRNFCLFIEWENLSISLSVAEQQEDSANFSCEEAITKEIAMETDGSIVVCEGGDKLEDGEGGGGEGVKSPHNQPMDLGSPLDSDPEFDLSSGNQDDSMTTLPKEQEIDKSGDLAEDVAGGNKQELTKENKKKEDKGGSAAKDDVKKEAVVKDDESAVDVAKTPTDSGNTGHKQRIERLDSTFDSSYEPSTEELLYEGDLDTETKPDTSLTTVEPAKQKDDKNVAIGNDKEPLKNEESNGAAREEEEGFMFEVHYKDQGGNLEEPAATTKTPATSSSKSTAKSSEKKGSGKHGSSSEGSGKSTAASDSARFVLSCRFPPFFSPQGYYRVYSNWSTLCWRYLFQLESTGLTKAHHSNWSTSTVNYCTPVQIKCDEIYKPVHYWI